MKALSIQQPWAWATLHGGKTIENRTWPTHLRGRFIIHAGKTIDKTGFPELRHLLNKIGAPSEDDEFEVGAFIGVADLYACIRYNALGASNLRADKWAAGPWCFLLRGIKPFARPIPGRGRLRFFDAPFDVAIAAHELYATEVAR